MNPYADSIMGRKKRFLQSLRMRSTKSSEHRDEYLQLSGFRYTMIFKYFITKLFSHKLDITEYLYQIQNYNYLSDFKLWFTNCISL